MWDFLMIMFFVWFGLRNFHMSFHVVSQRKGLFNVFVGVMSFLAGYIILAEAVK